VELITRGIPRGFLGVAEGRSLPSVFCYVRNDDQPNAPQVVSLAEADVILRSATLSALLRGFVFQLSIGTPPLG
jgi:hypothetical protein